MEFPRDRSDVYHVAFLLRQKLCADLVPVILDEAQYWTRRRVSIERATTISDAPEGKRILRTQPLSAAEHRQVRLVRFTSRSVAQCFDRSVWDRPQSPSCGNCDDSNKQLGSSGAATPNATVATETNNHHHHSHHATSPLSSSSSSPATSAPSTRPSSPLAGESTTTMSLAAATIVVDAKADRNKDEAFTWFEAHVSPSDAANHLYPDTTSRHEGATRAGAPRAEGQPADQGPRLMANCNTEESLCTYEAEWRWDAADKGERALVRGMRCGDVVDFTAHCSVFGWENFCKHAEIEMFFGHVRW